MRSIVTSSYLFTFTLIPSKYDVQPPKEISPQTLLFPLATLGSFIAALGGPSPKVLAHNLGVFSSLPEAARSRDRTFLTAILPSYPPDNSPGILGFPVDCRRRATFGGHNAFTILVGERDPPPPILTGVVYRDYVHDITIRRTKERARGPRCAAFCAFISVPL